MQNKGIVKNAFVVCIVGILLGTTVVPVVNTINIYDDSISNTNEIIQSSGDGNTLYVGGTGPNNYTKIQDAINDAKDGDTVFVYDDSSPYYENIVINKSVNLIGENRNTTIIDSNQEEDVVKVIASYVNISGLTIENGNWYGISIGYSYNIVVSDCNIYSNDVNGICIWNSSYNIISNCDFSSNEGSSILLEYSDNNILYHCIISNNKGDGISLEYSNNNIISSCNIYSSYYGIYLGISNSNKISHNNFVNNFRGALFHKVLIPIIKPNIFYHNYWDDWKLTFPKPILGYLIIPIHPPMGIEFPWLNFDLHPARESYEW